MVLPRPRSLTLEVMGIRLILAIDGAGASDLAAAVERAWDRCLVAPDVAGESTDGDDGAAAVRRVRVVLDPDPEVVARAAQEGAVAGLAESTVMDELTSRIVHEGLDTIIGNRLLLHAGALSDPQTGATAVLVAPSGTGKTTASQTLARTLGYVTDETSVIERDGSITPFPKPLSLLVNGQRPKRQVSPTELQMKPAHEAPWLARIAYLERDPEADGVREERVGTRDALILLAAQTSSLHLLEAPLESVAGLLESQGGLVRLVYAEATDLVPVIEGWLADAPRLSIPMPPRGEGAPATQPAQASPPVPATSVAPDGLEERVRRVPVIDELLVDDALVVMVSGQVFALSPMGSYLLLAIGDSGEHGTSMAELETLLAAEVPAPEEGTLSEALLSMVADLEMRGLVQRF